MAKIKGYFPSSQKPKVSNLVVRYKKENTSYTADKAWSNGAEDFAFADIIDGYFNTVFNKSSSVIDFGPHSCSITGAATPAVPDKFIHGRVIKVNNKPFEARKKAGEMVVSDFSRISAWVKYSNGGYPVLTGRESTEYFQWKTTANRGWKPLGGNMLDTFYIGNVETGMYGAFSKLYTEKTISDELNPYDVGWSDNWIKPFIDNELSANESLKSELINDVFAEANRETVDILTSFAELPETAIMCINACKTVLKLFKDAKRKELRLADKAKRVKVEYEEKIHRINFESRIAFDLARTARAKRIVENKRRARVSDARNTMNKFLFDLTTAISSVWLTFRYGIMPNVYLIEGLSKSLDDLDVLFRRYSDFKRIEIDPPDINGWSRTGTIQVEIRAFIKRRYESLLGWQKILKSFSANIFVTAWELIPLSFVVDWFINIGNVLSNGFGGNLTDYTEAATFSHKILSSSVRYTHVDTGCSVEIQFSGYKRRVINPRSYNCLQLTPNVDLFRQFDAAALTWNLVLKNFLKK